MSSVVEDVFSRNSFDLEELSDVVEEGEDDDWDDVEHSSAHLSARKWSADCDTSLHCHGYGRVHGASQGHVDQTEQVRGNVRQAEKLQISTRGK